jgi:hypothetical protein
MHNPQANANAMPNRGSRVRVAARVEEAGVCRDEDLGDATRGTSCGATVEVAEVAKFYGQSR